VEGVFLGVVFFVAGVFFAAGFAVFVFSLPVPPCPSTSAAANGDSKTADRMTNPDRVLSPILIDSSLENADRSRPRSRGFPRGVSRSALVAPGHGATTKHSRSHGVGLGLALLVASNLRILPTASATKTP